MACTRSARLALPAITDQQLRSSSNRGSSNISIELGTAVGVGTVVVAASDRDND